MRALGLLGLDVAATDYVVFEDQPAIIVTRYDRRLDRSGNLVRLHQEDMVQTFALDPRRKYEADDGPGVGKVVGRLRTAADEDSVTGFVDATIAGYLLGAPDGHAKNYSVLLIGRTARLAPAYDVSTGLIPGPTGRLRYKATAMSIGEEKRFGEVEGTHWERFTKVAGRAPELIRSRVVDLAQRLPDAFRDAISELADSPDTAYLTNVVLPNLAALDAQTLSGLHHSRRTDGRVVTPFLRALEPATASDADARADASANDAWDAFPHTPTPPAAPPES